MAKSSKYGNIVFYRAKEGALRWFDPDKAKTPEGKAKIKAIRSGGKVASKGGKITEMTQDRVAKANKNLETKKIDKEKNNYSKAQKDFTNASKKSYKATEEANKINAKINGKYSRDEFVDTDEFVERKDAYKKANQASNELRRASNENERAFGATIDPSQKTRRDKLNIDRAKNRAESRANAKKVRDSINEKIGGNFGDNVIPNNKKGKTPATDVQKLLDKYDKNKNGNKSPKVTEMTPERKTKALDALEKKRTKEKNDGYWKRQRARSKESAKAEDYIEKNAVNEYQGSFMPGIAGVKEGASKEERKKFYKARNDYNRINNEFNKDTGLSDKRDRLNIQRARNKAKKRSAVNALKK